MPQDRRCRAARNAAGRSEALIRSLPAHAHVDAAVDVERAERDHERRHLGEGDEGAVDQAEQGAEDDPDERRPRGSGCPGWSMNSRPVR